MQENYNINSLTGNTYNVIVQANGNTNIEAIPDGVYEVETPHYDIDFAYESYTDYNSYITKQTSLIAYKSYVPSVKTENRNEFGELVNRKYDYSTPSYNYSQPVDYTNGQVFYNPVNGKYYVAFGSEYYNEVTGLTALMNIDNWRGYVNDTYINNTSLRTSDFATDINFKN